MPHCREARRAKRRLWISARLASGNGRVTIENWAGIAQAPSRGGKTRSIGTRTSNFAGWTATVDGGLAEIKEGAVKNVVIDLPEGAHSVTLELRSTPARRAGNLITIPAGASVFDNHRCDPLEIGVRQKTGAVPRVSTR